MTRAFGLALIASLFGCAVEPTPPPVYDKVARAISGSCALMSDGSVRCWDRKLRAGSPVAVFHSVKRLAASNHHGCVLDDAGDVLCWGSSGSGEVGPGTYDGKWTPTFQPPRKVAIAHGAIDLMAGSDKTCAIMEGGRLVCWGGGGYLFSGCEGACLGATPAGCERDVVQATTGFGMFGDWISVRLRDGSVRAFCDSPSDPIAPAIDLSAGYLSRCALHENGTITCIGIDRGQLGRPALPGDDERTVRITELPAVAQLAGTGGYTCARTRVGEVFCFGDWSYVPTPAESWPHRIEGLTGVTHIAVGASACALRSDGSVWCWDEDHPSPTEVVF